MFSRSRTDFCRDSSSPGKLRLNFRGREDETRELRFRERLRLDDDRLEMSEMGRARAVRIAADVLSMDVRAVRYWRRGDESDEDVGPMPMPASVNESVAKKKRKSTYTLLSSTLCMPNDFLV